MTVIIILSTVILFGVIIKLFIPSEKLESLSQITSIIGGVVTAISLIWAAFTFYKGAQLQRELAAYNIYQEHLKLSIDYPDLANPKLSPNPPKDGDSMKIKKYEKYRWYVGYAIFSFETILDVFPDDKEWKRTASAFIIDHQDYICSDSFPCNRYTKNIQELVKNSLGKDCCCH